jgi:hypothetical protein
MRIHHIDMLLHTAQELDQVSEALRLRGAAVPYAGSSHGVSFLHVDTRADLGHYLEYIHLSGPARHFWEMFRSIRQAPGHLCNPTPRPLTRGVYLT